MAKKYVLVEFPYPSGDGLHMGHAFSFTGGDVYARCRRMRGDHVLFPIGWDAFGLPTENYAIRMKRAPAEVTAQNTARFREQMERLRLSFDWDRLVDTTDPDYYRFTQWIFLKLHEHGLAYKSEMPINWCPSCRVGLANEEVVDGACERCGTAVTRRRISQWVVRITEYADRLLAGLQRTSFVEKVKAAQVNWIGRSRGATIRFPVVGAPGSIEVFTTRPDTLPGATFLVIAPEHTVVASLVKGASKTDAVSAAVAEYVAKSARRSDLERTSPSREKSGVATGVRVTNPMTGTTIPVWVSDFVLGGYGTGAIMAVPAHDERDHEFALQYGLPIVPVIEPPEEPWDFTASAYAERRGRIVAPGPLQGLDCGVAIDRAVAWLEAHAVGEASISYHLRDWIFSRQHYWGEPIPMIECPRCGWVRVPEADLPVRLPTVEAYEPTDTGESPLAALAWVHTACPQCGSPARRETDTMPNWAGSNWYFLRYCDPHNGECIADLQRLREWMPVDVYIGGDEHNTLHLLYSRFIYLFLHDIGAVPSETPEPYLVRFSHGVILAPDGHRMSKSRGNVIVPDEYITSYGADALRTYLMFIGPFEATMAWDDRAMRGVRRFLDRLERAADRMAESSASASNEDTDEAILLARDAAVERVTRDIDRFSFNTAVAALMELVNVITKALDEGSSVSAEVVADTARMLAPFAPDTAETVWKRVVGRGNVHDAGWPHVVETHASATVTIVVQVNGKVRGSVEVERDVPRDAVERAAHEAGTVASHLEGRTIRRVVHVPNRLVNFVV